MRARISHGETLSGAARGEQIACCCAVKHCVADDGVFCRDQRAVHGWAHDDCAAGQAFAHIVVGIAADFQLQARGRESAQRLTRIARQFHRQVVGLQIIAHPEAAHDVAGQACADRSVGVLSGI